ncbi:MAG: DUF421 domain-containing protein [Clostridiales bacterium]|nr:DUF421 domain-containing protein [Clostridiales bacterium]
MFTIVSRAVIIYLLVLFLYRLMGKRQLGQMQPFELVLTLIIADLATIPMAEVTVPVLHGVIPLLTLTILHFFISLFCKISNKFSAFVSGKPVIVINPKGIDYRALKNLSLSVDDVFEAIRGCGYFSIEQIQYAIMETNGKMSVLPKSDFAPVTVQDLNLNVEKSVIPLNIINEGKIVKENIKLAQVDQLQIKELLKQANIKRVKDCLVLTIDKNGGVFIQGYGSHYQTLQTKPLGQVNE